MIENNNIFNNSLILKMLSKIWGAFSLWQYCKGYDFLRNMFVCMCVCVCVCVWLCVVVCVFMYVCVYVCVCDLQLINVVSILQYITRSRGAMDNASDYESGDCRFDPCQSR